MGIENRETKNSPNPNKNFIDRIREKVNSKVAESKFPSKEAWGYESMVGIYGGKLVEEDGRLIFDTTGWWSRIDQRGDRLLRTVDEHHVKDPMKMAIRHPRAFFKTILGIADAKRYRGTPEQTMENVRRFGLEEMYGPHPKGIEIKNPEAYKKSINLQDIYRQDLIGSPALDDIDRFQATAEVARYIRSLHDKAGGGRIPGRMVVAHQIVVYGLGNVDATQCVVGAPGFFADDAHRVRGIIAADVEEIADAMRLEHLEDLLAVAQIGFVAGGAERGRWRVGHHL
jgi:hypothetical protein